jgi:hypothetical protein
MKLQHMKLDYMGRGVRVYVAQDGNGSVAVVLRNEGGRRYRQTYRSTGGDGAQAWDRAMADALAAEQRIIDAIR